MQLRVGRRTWRPGDDRVEISEADAVSVEAGPGEQVQVGGVRFTGGERFRFVDHAELGGHLGLLDVVVDGRRVGEVAVVPAKMPPGAFERLRADLERVWAGLIFDPAGTANVELASHDLEDIWRKLEPVVMDILREPRGELRREPRLGHVERFRGPIRGPAALRGALTRTPVQLPGTVRTTAIPENRLVGDTLRLLVRALQRDPDVHGIDPLLPARLAARPELEGPSTAGIPWGARSDPRYRQVLVANRRLRSGTFRPTEGPGEARRGIRSLPRLYEYWVYLKVLEQARALYGPPVRQFEELHRPMFDGTTLLSLPAGTTVEFPGPVYVAFEPAIMSDGRGWMELEYVPHPDPALQKFVATPDVVVYRPGSLPWMTVIDAKYVARHRVEVVAAELHAKYSRIRAAGEPVVRMVLAAHPHRDLTHRWAGYGVHAFDPGSAVTQLPLPSPVRRDQTVGATGVDRRVVVDQQWMARVLGPTERMDFASLVAGLVQERPTTATYVIPDVPVLAPLARAAERHGLQVVLSSGDEDDHRAAVVRAVTDAAAAGGDLVLVSGDPRIVERAELARIPVDVVTDVRDLLDDGARSRTTFVPADPPVPASAFDDVAFEREAAEVLRQALPEVGSRILLANLGALLQASSAAYRAKGGRKLSDLLAPLAAGGTWTLVEAGTVRAAIVRVG